MWGSKDNVFVGSIRTLHPDLTYHITKTKLGFELDNGWLYQGALTLLRTWGYHGPIKKTELPPNLHLEASNINSVETLLIHLDRVNLLFVDSNEEYHIVTVEKFFLQK